ncbi:energy transducer TonB [Aurantivibrio plasticivorans]
MNLSRIITSAISAVFITAVLIVVMFKLVDREWEEPEERKKYNFSEFNKPPEDIETNYDTAKPDKPETPETPPETPPMDIDLPDVPQDSVSVAQPTLNADLNIDTTGGFKSDGEYLPIVRVEPIYPTRAAQRGIEGWVIVEFTVTANGSVRDPVVIESEPSSIFNRAAERAVLKWKFKPRVIDGNPIEVPGVRNKLTFQLAK